MADYSVTLDPFLRGIDAAQQRQYRTDDRAFQNWQRQQAVTTTQNAQALDRALGEGALARMEAAQAPAISNVVATIPPPAPSPLAAPAPQMSATPALESVTARPQMSEWTQPVQVETQVRTPGATFRNADMIRRVAAVPGGGKAAYDMAMADEKSATAARASLYKMLHDAKTPADVEIAVQMANEAGAGIPPNLVKSKQFATALVQAGTVAHQLGNKDQAFKAVLGALMKGEDPAAVIGQLSGDSGFKPHGQPVVDKSGNYVFLGSDGKMHQAEIDGKAVGAGARPRAAGGGGDGTGKSPRVAKTLMDDRGNWWVTMSDGTSRPLKDASGNQLRGAQNEGNAARYAKMYADADMMGEGGSAKVDAAIRRGREAARPGGTPAGGRQNASPYPDGTRLKGRDGASYIVRGGVPVKE